MGNSYTNLTLRGPDPSAVAEALKGRSAFITPKQNNCVVVLDEESDAQDLDALSRLAQDLSSKLSCPTLAVMNHDDDVLLYALYDNGVLVDEYNSSPDYFEDGPSRPPESGDAETLCIHFKAENRDAVEQILRRPQGTEDGYIFAVERHQDLIAALGLPSIAAGLGYRYAREGDFPDDLEDEDLLRLDSDG